MISPRLNTSVFKTREVTAIGGSTRCARRKKNADKGYVFSGVNAERPDREKGVKIGENEGGGYPNRYDQSSEKGELR